MSLYTIETPPKTRIENALVYRLKTITKDNGFLTDVRGVFDGLKVALSDITETPCILYVFKKEDTLEFSSGDRPGDTNASFYPTATVDLYCIVKDADFNSAKLEIIKRDVLHLLGLTNWMLYDSNGQPTAQLVRWTGAEIFPSLNKEPRKGIRIGLAITYAHDYNQANA